MHFNLPLECIFVDIFNDLKTYSTARQHKSAVFCDTADFFDYTIFAIVCKMVVVTRQKSLVIDTFAI